jgi:hypothetical protein
MKDQPPPLSEGGSYDYGRGFIVRILGGLKRDRGGERGEGESLQPLLYFIIFLT